MGKTVASCLYAMFFTFAVLDGESDGIWAQETHSVKPEQTADMQSPDELLLFFPAKYPAGDWAPQGLTFQDVYFRSKDGTKLHGWFCPVENPRAVVLMAHGNAGHVASRAGWLKYLQSRARVTVFIFDYRGYGRSEGKPTVKGALEDATAARSQLCQLAGVADSEIVLMGESLGGAIMVQLAVQATPRALILQSTFTSLQEVAKVHFPKLAWLVLPKKLNSLETIVAYRGPLLHSHGTADQTIPFSMGQALFRAAKEPKRWIAIQDAGHNDWLTDEYLGQLDAFIEQLPKVAP